MSVPLPHFVADGAGPRELPAPVAGAAATTGHPAAIQFRGVHKRYGETVALDGVDLSLEIGQTIALLGPNGAGKSTAIGLMLGLLDPTAGEVRTLGLTPRAAVGSGRVGAMLQSGGLPGGALVGEVVEFARRLYPRPLDRDDILERAGVEELANRRVEALSGGETTRVRFALAIAGDPDLVFLDEPTVGMDVESRRAFWSEMHRFAAEGRTVPFATHYLEEADEAADRIVVLGHGRVLADGTSTSIKATASGRTVRFSLPHPDPSRLGRLPGVTSVSVHGDSVALMSADSDATVYALVASGIRVRDLEIAGVGLEDAFLALTAEAA